MWTESKVKLARPVVRVRIPMPTGGDYIADCRIGGTSNRFATVSPLLPRINHMSWEFSWLAIAHSLNAGKPLRIS